MDNKYVRFPASDLAGIVGFALMTIAVIVVAKKLPFVKGLV